MKWSAYRNALRPLLLAICLAAPVATWGFSPVEPLSDGWHGKAKFGAHSVRSGSASRQMLAAAALDYRSDRFENRFNLELLRVQSNILIKDVGDDGIAVFDARGNPGFRKIKTRTADRRFVGIHPQWFFHENSYVMLIMDYEQNEPEGLESSSRRIAGFGHRVWNSKHNLLAGEVGVGSRRLRVNGAEPLDESIGYVGVKFSRDLSKRTRLTFEMDADFGSDERFAQLKLGLRYKMTDNVALRVKYSTRTNREIRNSTRPRIADRDSETSLYLEFDLF